MAGSAAATALATGLSEQDVAAFFQMFGHTPRVVTLYSQGVNQSAQGTDKVNAILNCHLATGRIGKPGASPFSLTGQPNAMGGREVGGLANQLAAHMGFTPPDIDRVRRFWKAPRIATHEGLKAVQMFEAIARGEIKALWVMGTNPAVSLPDADAARAALKKLELFVISENVGSNDTVNAGAHVLLPAQAWGEKSGTVTNSERRISRQRAFLTPPGEAKPDWWIVGEVAKRLGFGAAFAFNSAAEVFREHAALSAFENSGGRDFDIGALKSLSDDAFDAMAPVLWPHRLGDTEPQQRFFADGGFFSNDHKARFIAPEIPALRTETTAGRPLRLNTGRIRDQWHTMTRTGISPRLGQHLPEPFVEIHPDDASRSGVVDGGFARVVTDYGQCLLRVVVSERQQRGMLFAPIHWSEVTASAARVGALVAPFTDPFSGQPENKATPASIVPYEYVFRGFALSRVQLPLPTTPGGRASPSPAATAICSPTMPIWGMAVLVAVGRRQRSRRIPGLWRRRLPRGLVCRGSDRNLPVHGPRAGCRRLECRQEPVRGRRPQRRSAPDVVVRQVDGRACQRRPHCLRLFRCRPHHDLRRHRGGRGLRRRDRRAAQGRHQLRLVHSGIEAPDRAG
jgi:assimilatory nitrate reductase catalytic subunit